MMLRTSWFNEFTKISVIHNPSRRRIGVTRWTKPPIGWLKLNVDGAYYLATRRGGSEAILRTRRGESATHREALAIWPALISAHSNPFDSIMVASDCQQLARDITQVGVIYSQLWPIIEDIKALLAQFQQATIKHVRRDCNSVAHILAQKRDACETPSSSIIGMRFWLGKSIRNQICLSKYVLENFFLAN